MDEQTHHGANGRFSTPRMAKTVTRGGDRYKVVMQRRRMVPYRHSPDNWTRFGDHLYRRTEFVGKSGAVPFGGERYTQVKPPAIRRAIRAFAPLLRIDPKLVLKSISLNVKTPFVVRAELKKSADQNAWTEAIRLFSAAGYTLVVDAFGDSPTFGGKEASEEAVSSGGTFLMKRG